MSRDSAPGASAGATGGNPDPANGGRRQGSLGDVASEPRLLLLAAVDVGPWRPTDAGPHPPSAPLAALFASARRSSPGRRFPRTHGMRRPIDFGRWPCFPPDAYVRNRVFPT